MMTETRSCLPRQSVSSRSSMCFSSPEQRHTSPLTGWRCRTCNRPIHTSGDTVGECLIICISTHQTKLKWTKIQQDLPEPVLMPTRIQDLALLFDDIWFDFQELKDTNEKHRQCINSTSKDRGALKDQAPLPWLLYRRRDSKSGQTRNQENYNQIWARCVNDDDGLGAPVRFLTIKQSDLAENAIRSRLSNDSTRPGNMFTPSRTLSASSSVCDSSVMHQARVANSISPVKVTVPSVSCDKAYWNDFVGDGRSFNHKSVILT